MVAIALSLVADASRLVLSRSSAYDACVSTRSLILLTSAVRGAWGLGAFAAPGAMRRSRLVGTDPDLELPDPRLYVRGFGGHQVLIAGFTIAALRSDERMLRHGLLLSVLIDGLDIASAVGELAARRQLDPTPAAGIVFSGGGALSNIALLRALDR
jgi:hypothetical protein